MRFRKKASKCPQHFGYLSGIPEGVLVTKECLICPKMAGCMLARNEVALTDPQLDFMKEKIGELTEKAGFIRAPQLCISKRERLAGVNLFQKRISVGEHLLSLWCRGNFEDKDVEAILAHEIGHLMDFRCDSHSHSFRNLTLESLWFVFGAFPIIFYVLSPSLLLLLFSVSLAAGWGFSLPWLIRRVDTKIEFEADKNAALFLVEPQQLAKTLAKIGGLPAQVKFGLRARPNWLVYRLSHPPSSERISRIDSL